MYQLLLQKSVHRKNDLWDNTERNKVSIRNSKAEITWTSPKTHVCLTLFGFELKEALNVIICICARARVCVCEKKKHCISFKYFSFSILPF